MMCTKCRQTKRDEEFEYYVTEQRHSSWCRRCKLEFYRGFQNSIRAGGQTGRKLREAAANAWLAGDWLCCYCGVPLTPANITEDHVTALVEGGTGHEDNINFVCRSCNSSKKAKSLKEWL